jgi:hypothetical protein
VAKTGEYRMEKTTKQAIGKMRGLIIDFLHVSNTIPSLEWVEVVRSIQKEKEKLKRIENLVRLGNIFVMLFFLQEILEEIIEDDKPP